MSGFPSPRSEARSAYPEDRIRRRPPPRRDDRRRPVVAAFLSFLVPGLGQAWLGAWLRGLLFALPVLIVIAVIAVLASRSLAFLFGILLLPPVHLFLIVLNVLAIGYRIYAILDAYRMAAIQVPLRQARRNESSRGGAIVLALATIALLTHGWLAYLSYNAFDLVTGVFAGAPGASNGGFDPDDSISPSPVPPTPPSTRPGPSGEPQPSPTPSPSPTPTFSGPAWAADGRLNVLLLGGDAGPGRFGLRTDTLILATVDVESGRAALFGIPRNLNNVPLPPASKKAFRCGCFPEFFFGLYKYASDHPDIFPGDDEHRGLRAVAGSVEELTGVELDGLVLVDLAGFIELIDALGGVDINVANRIVDNAYPREDGGGDIQIVIEAGRQHMDGLHALRYARTRHADSDYHRMQRQQVVLLALRKQMNVCSLLPRVSELVDIAKRTLTTDIDYRELPSLLELAARVDSDRIQRAALNPPEIPEDLRAQDVARIHKIVADVFKGPAPPPDEGDDDQGPC